MKRIWVKLHHVTDAVQLFAGQREWSQSRRAAYRITRNFLRRVLNG